MSMSPVHKLLTLPKRLARGHSSGDVQHLNHINSLNSSVSTSEENNEFPVLELPTDSSRSNVKTYIEASQSLLLDSNLSNSLKHLDRLQDIELSIKLLSAFYLLLDRYTHQNNVILGTQIFDGDLVRSGIIHLRSQDLLNFIQLSHHVRGAIDLARKFNFNSTINNAFKFSSLEHQDDVSSLDNQGLDLILDITEKPEGLACAFIYNSNLFKAQTIERMSGHWQTLLVGIVANPESNLLDLPLLTTAEQEQILVTWNDTKNPKHLNNCIHHLFEAQAQKTPEKIAVVFEKRELTYGELEDRANRLAAYLQERGIQPDSLVGICVERSLEMVIGILAVLKAGGAYVPLDPTYPVDRLNYMVQDTQLSILLTQSSLNLNLESQHPIEIIYLDRLDSLPLPRELEKIVRPHHLAYVIYTSGSTGKPKGVQIEHSSAVNLLMAMAQDKPGITATDTLLSVTTICFDISVAEIFLPLIVGGQLIVVSRQVAADGKTLSQTFDRHDVTVMQATPVTWQLLLAAEWQGNSKLKILTGGEPLSKDLAAKLLPRCAQLWNVYGPTEATIWSSAYRVTSSDTPISIGRPLSNVRYYILDSQMRSLPVGVPGELYIGGDCLARGYLNRSQLTQERFILNPFTGGGDRDRIYKTGDLARYLEDGSVECLGRIDRQVKIRGFRIEIGEIETFIGQYPGIKEVVVVDLDDRLGMKRLVAYLVVEDRRDNSSSSLYKRELRSFLQQKLPSYMIPSTFVTLESLPQTLNGKIDRKALPPLDLSNQSLDDNYVAPRNSLEAQLVSIWEKILQIEPIGVQSEFTDLGGNSIVAVSLIAEVERELQTTMPLKALSSLTTIEQMAESLKLRQEIEELSFFSTISSEKARLLFTIVAGRNGKRHRSDSLMVALREGGFKTPFFFCANAEEEVAPLAEYLDPERPFYFLESGYFAIEGTQAQVKELATHHIRDILAIQPQAPYFLCGYSFGGILAWEIARQLEALGYPVAILFILDTPGDQASYQIYERLDYTFRTNWNRLTRLFRRSQIAQTESHSKIDQPAIEKQDSYTIQSYTGRVSLFVATQATSHSFFSQQLKLLLFPKLGWQLKNASQLEVTKIQGDHFSILRSPHVQVLAAKLNNYLAREDLKNNAVVEIVLKDGITS